MTEPLLGQSNLDWCGDSDPAINGSGLWECPECGHQATVEYRDGLCAFCDATPMRCLIERKDKA